MQVCILHKILTVFLCIISAWHTDESILACQAEGIAITKAAGKYKGRKKIESADFAGIYTRWTAKEITATKAMELLGMKPNTFYRRVKEFQAA